MNRFRFGLPAVSALVAGLGALVFIIAGTRSLGLEEFAAVSQLWTVWAIAYSVVTFSVQQVTIRSLSAGRAVPWRQVLLPAIAMVVVAAPILYLGRVRLFGSDVLAWPLVGTLIPLGSLLTGVARGKLAAVGDEIGLALAVGGENCIRAVLAVALAVAGLGSAWFAAAILLGFGAAFAGLRRVEDTDSAATPALTGDAHPLMGVANSVAGLSSHSMLVVAPAVLALASVPPATVSAVFVVLAVYRSPYQLILGVAPSLSNDLIRRAPALTVEHRRRAVGRLMLVGLAAAAAGALVAAALGELVVAPLFGAGGVLAPIDHALAAALTMLAVVSIVLTLLATALDEPLVLLIVWPIAAVLGIGSIVVGDLGPTAALASLVLAEATVAAALFLAVRRVGAGDLRPESPPSGRR